MEQRNIIAEIEAGLTPKGTAPLIRLTVGNSSGGGYYNQDFVTECVTTLKKRMHEFSIAQMMGEPGRQLNALERLGLDVLASSAGVELPYKKA